MHDITEIVGHSFPKVMTEINIQAEYRVAGLVQVNRDVFEDVYFMPAEIRDCAIPMNNTTPETDSMVQKHTVLLVIHLMYTLHPIVTSFKKDEPRNNKCVRSKSSTRIRIDTPEKQTRLQHCKAMANNRKDHTTSPLF